MNRSIYTMFAFGAAAIGLTAGMMFALWGWLGMVLYLVPAAICMLPAVLAARRLTRQQTILNNRLDAAEHALDEIDRQLNTEDR